MVSAELLIEWLAQNFGAASRLQEIVAVFAVLIVAIVIVWINRLVYVRIERLGKL